MKIFRLAAIPDCNWLLNSVYILHGKYKTIFNDTACTKFALPASAFSLLYYHAWCEVDICMDTELAVSVIWLIK